MEASTQEQAKLEKVHKSCSEAWLNGTGRPEFRESLCQAYGGRYINHLEKGSTWSKAAPKGKVGVHGEPQKVFRSARGSVWTKGAFNCGASSLPFHHGAF